LAGVIIRQTQDLEEWWRGWDEIGTLFYSYLIKKRPMFPWALAKISLS